MEEKSRVFSLHGLPLRFVQLVLVAAFLLMNCLPAMAQSGVRVKGVVKSGTDGEPLIGVNIVQKGTTNGTVTDLDGAFEITVPVGADLDISYIGYLAQQVKIVAGKTTYEVTLREDALSLDEVVVVGYGVQKKKLITGATVQVSGNDIQKMSTTSALTALQSQTPGVNITQSTGQPGGGFKVTIRGLGTVGSSTPLYVIDGITGGDINNLNPADIESVDVLKDAASAAIYGARAANGVVLITTKQGKAGKMTLTYDGYAGVQNIYKMPSLLTAKEYMSIIDEMRFNEGNEGYNWQSLLPGYLYDGVMNGTWQGTNWLESIRNENALTQNHAINLTGGNDISKFSMGFSYTNQEGTLGVPAASNFNRYTARINSEHVLYKVNNMNVITIGENLTYMYRQNNGIEAGNIYWNDVHNMLVGNPLMPIYDQEGNYYDQNSKDREGWKFDGSAVNPIGSMMYTSRGQNLSKGNNLRTNVYIEIQPIKDLKFRSVFGYNMSAGSYRAYGSAHRLSSTNSQLYDEVSQNSSTDYSYSWENTLAYSYVLNDQHQFDAVIGQSFEKWGLGEEVQIRAKKSLFPNNFDYAWINNTKPTDITDIPNLRGFPYDWRGALASFFGRVNYNYKETYMASVIMRTDGSSNFARGNRWGYFPSVSAGWVITNEAFMESTQNWLDFFKIRGSWGQNGNQSIANFQYLATISFDDNNSYFFGDSKKTRTSGGYADILPNLDVTWETSEQLDFGFDARFANSRLGLAFDWYKKTTKNWLVEAPTLTSYGTGAPFINGGDIVNEGVEVALNWNDNIGDFRYGIILNGAYNRNEVTRIANEEKIIHGLEDVLSQGTGEMYRAQKGYPLGYFWGYKTEGVYQNQAQIDERRAAGKGTLATAQPGDVIFADVKADGVITDADKTMIGNPHPDFTGGLTLTFGYKGFDLSATAYGAFGQQVAKSYRSFADSPLHNYTTDVYQRWTGEGTSNKWPRLTSGSHTNYQYISDIWIEDADFVKLQNLTLGYDFKTLFPKVPFGQLRLYVTAQNLFTITGYSGMDPEVGYGGDTNGQGRWASGIDLGFYPTNPRTYLVGLNLKF